MCYNTVRCSNKSSKFKYVEAKLLKGLEEWLEEYKAEWKDVDENKPDERNTTFKLHKLALNKLENKLKELEGQKNNLHDLVERSIYDVDTYLERSQILAERIDDTKISIKNTNKDLELEEKRIKAQKDIIPKVEKVLELYPKAKDPEQKNKLLKSVLDYAVYKKDKEQWNDEFTLILYPKLPK